MKEFEQRKGVSRGIKKFYKVYRDGIFFRVREKGKGILTNNDHINFSDITNRSGFVILRDSKTKRLASVELDSDNLKRKLFIKVYKCHGIFNKLKYFFRQSKGYREWKLAAQVESKGVFTIVPLAIGEKRKLGVLQESMVVAEMLENGIDLEDLFLKNEKIRDVRLKRKIIHGYGRWARELHNKGILQEDFDPNNVLFQWDDNEKFRLFLIDFERVKLFKNLSIKKRVRSLAKLNRVRKVGKTDRLRFIKSYLGGDLNDRQDLREWLTSIQEDEKKVLLRDCRRAARKCVTRGERVGYLNNGSYRGYYRRRKFPLELQYSQKDILAILSALEYGEVINRRSNEGMPVETHEVEVDLGERVEKFKINCFHFSGMKYWLLRLLKRTPTFLAWRAANVLFKKSLAPHIPIAAVEKKISFKSYQGFLMVKTFLGTDGEERGRRTTFLKFFTQLKTLPYSKYFE